LFTYTNVAPSTFNLKSSNGETNYSITNNTKPVLATTTSNCPTGFIPVPGSGTYNTNDFCVMKYEAKDAGSNIPVSTATSTPWGSITQTNAIAYSSNVAGCTGCHLITEAEWLTIAQNVLSEHSNWSSNVVGSGYIYSGHNDNAPTNALAASTDDGAGYYGETNTGGNQKRTLNLTNGQVIWDLAGNVWEWTSGQTTSGQPGIAGNIYAGWIEWSNVTTSGTLFPNVFPSGTGITGASSWTSANGIGQLISDSNETGVSRGFLRSGTTNSPGYAGVLSLFFPPPSYSTASYGFRVSR